MSGVLHRCVLLLGCGLMILLARPVAAWAWQTSPQVTNPPTIDRTSPFQAPLAPPASAPPHQSNPPVSTASFTPASPSAQRVWDGGGGSDTRWSLPANWANDTLPQPWDDLVFPAAQITATNDFPPFTTFNSIVFQGGTPRLSGNGVALNAGITGFPSLGLPMALILLPVRLNASQTFSNLKVAGGLDLNGFTLTLNGTMAMESIIADSAAGGKLNIQGASVVFRADNTFTGETIVNSGYIHAYSPLPGPITLDNNSTLQGDGPVGPTTVISGTLRPYNYDGIPGPLQINGNLSLNSAATTDGSWHNLAVPLLVVTGTVSLGNSNLNLEYYINSSWQTGDVFTIIENDGADPVVGTFAGFPEGTIFNPGYPNRKLQMSYVGGDGNDVVIINLGLITTGITRTWDGGGIDGNWSTPANWVGDLAPQPGDNLLFPESAARLTNNNDLPHHTPFNSITFEGNGYRTSGNLFSLNAGVVVSGSGGTVRLPTFMLEESQTLVVNDSGATLDIETLHINTFTLTVEGAGAITLPLTGQGDPTNFISRVIKNGSGTLTLAPSASSSEYNGPITINAGIVSIESLFYAPVDLTGGLLTSEGDSASVFSINASGGILDPGQTPNLLHVTDYVTLTANTTLLVDLNGTSMVTGYDQLQIEGPVNLGGSQLQVRLGFTPTAGDSFTIIWHDGTTPIIGTFNGLPEGATFTVGTTQFAISYVGGDGNDVVLTVQAPTALSLNQFGPSQDTRSWRRPLGALVLLAASLGLAFGWRRRVPATPNTP
jgi:fibronectin-binding autotransporter adhesin